MLYLLTYHVVFLKEGRAKWELFLFKFLICFLLASFVEFDLFDPNCCVGL